MAAYFRNLPFFAILIFAAGVAMLLPAAVATATQDYRTGRVFLYAGLMVLMAATLLGFACQTPRRPPSERSHLASLFLAYLWLPLILALPMEQVVGNTRFINVYFDMVSALTTTGAQVFDPARLAPAVHLWRGLVGWCGGLLIWITAFAVLAPLNLGGYEVTSEATVQGQIVNARGQMRAAGASERLRKHALRLTPIYAGLTAALAIALTASGEAPLVAAVHAMSTLATSGISPLGGLQGSPTGLIGEALIFVFFLFALSRRTYSSGIGRELRERLTKDREIRLALFAGIVLPTLLFARHWVGALEVDELSDAGAALSALWGSVFTVISFLTTTGFVSDAWGDARAWSGLQTPGLLLVGLVLMGGGVATTAGGVKLLRVYALYKHGVREMGKLIYPNSVAGAGRLGRRIRREGAYIAWVVFMLLVLSIAAVMVALASTGLDFEDATILAIATLTTTGPLASVAGATPIDYFMLSDAAKLICAGAMIVGRIETLVMIALLNPGFWRD
ncbi:TrkH family potassium uptake protein [Rhodobacteraceae bacterium N5(2021)]|uniref:TrkH family potassium uptake protein n=1 Tax=Gymnodinialimonas phycosphaerae TaxID=2841589 RepID=A0A975TX29_9RHOB|nr:potassium transporter TrkG [Gymnodinialimonas phycosphaerae]MBY4892113.1 TrkH family potassium uptake protein [Gymnodinialimonas phycosphaerae]